MQRYNKIIQKTSVKKEAPLDKLAQLSPTDFENTLHTLRKRAKAKYFTNSYTIPLASLKSELQKSYNNTIYGCSNVLSQSDNKITSHYCNNRWCIVCNRIRTAKLINGYKNVLDTLPNKYFVSLTVPNVDSMYLRSTIQEMTRTFQNIRKYFHKQKIHIIGLRKLECTYNEKTRQFHPHFHFIVSGSGIAEKLVLEWLKRYPKASRQAQDYRPADSGCVLELFKYFSKIITNNVVYVNALDKIFIAMRGLRVYQPLGIKKVSEEVEEVQAQIITDLKLAEKTWSWIDCDWIDTDTGEVLTGYTPDETMKTLVTKNIQVYTTEDNRKQLNTVEYDGILKE